MGNIYKVINTSHNDSDNTFRKSLFDSSQGIAKYLGKAKLTNDNLEEMKGIPNREPRYGFNVNLQKYLLVEIKDDTITGILIHNNYGCDWANVNIPLPVSKWQTIAIKSNVPQVKANNKKTLPLTPVGEQVKANNENTLPLTPVGNAGKLTYKYLEDEEPKIGCTIM